MSNDHRRRKWKPSIVSSRLATLLRFLGDTCDDLRRSAMLLEPQNRRKTAHFSQRVADHHTTSQVFTIKSQQCGQSATHNEKFSITCDDLFRALNLILFTFLFHCSVDRPYACTDCFGVSFFYNGTWILVTNHTAS